LSKGSVTAKILEIEIAEEAPETGREEALLEEDFEELFSHGKIEPAKLIELFCPLAAASKNFELDRIARLRGGAQGPAAGYLPRAGRCAVVSNSGVMLNYHYGPEIDESDLVFRFNDADLSDEFAPFVGTRDDIRIVNGEFGIRVQQGLMKVKPGTEYVLLRALPKQLEQALEAHGQHSEAHVVLGSPKLGLSALGLLNRMYGVDRGMMTSGFLGVGLAMTLCDEVKAYGFAETPGTHTAPFHYYGEQRTGTADRNIHHKLAVKEKEFWKQVAMNDDVDTTDVTLLPGTRTLNCTGYI